MTAKIEWYREILELEPGSRVFFPLARLLTEAGEKQEAMAVLRKGLQRHPDFLEARLALVHLLHTEKNTDATTECDQEVATITRLFKKYPAFWDAWAESEQGSDAALAIRFLKTAIDSPGVSLSEIFLRGLGAVGLIATTFPAKTPQLESDQVPMPAKSQQESASQPNMPPEMPPEMPPKVNPLQQAAQYLSQSVVSTPATQPSEDVAEEEDTESEDSTVTVRTRSMAELLVLQGDIPGALEIYQELEAKAATPEEAAELKKRIKTLVDAERTAPVAETPDTASELAEDVEEMPQETTPDTPSENTSPASNGNQDIAHDAPASDESNGNKDLESASGKSTINLLEKLAQGLEERAKK